MRTIVQLAGVGATLVLSAAAGAQTFTNASAITIPDSGTATPYPSSITVAGLTNFGNLGDVNITINGFTHTWCSDVDIVVVGPTGRAMMVLSDAGGANDPSGSYTFDDSAAVFFPAVAPLTAGTYKPSNVGAGDAVLPPPFPAVPPVTVPPWNSATPALSVFNGTNGNGTWSLYVVDDTGGDLGAISSGWSVVLTTANDCLNPLPHPFCVADVNNDNNVSVNDLLAVISNWGITGPPRPVGDVNPLPNGNCTVNVNDLLAVISAWGVCALPTGGCCATNGTCTTISQTACDASGGNYQGNGVACPVCPVVPANDNPGGAFTLVAGAFPAISCNAGTNAGATLTTAIPNPACTFGGPANHTRDVWWKYTVPTAPGLFGQILRVDTCSNVAPFTDTVLAAYTGTFPTFTEVACNDDAACGAVGLNSRIQVPLIPSGQTVYIRVGSWSTGATNQGAINLCVSAANVTQDDCLGAKTIAIGGSDTGTLQGATQDFAPQCQSVGAGFGKWYKLVLPGPTPPPPPPNAGSINVSVSTCSSVSDVYDGAISVYCAGDLGCSALNCVAATNADQGTPQTPPCTAFQGETVTFCGAPGNTYYILVNAAGAGLPTGITGNYTVTVSSRGSCTNNINCLLGSPPANDECASAIVVPVGTTAFTNAIATPVTAGTGAICGQPWSKDVWFRYTSSNGGTVTVTVTSTPVWDSVIDVYNGIGCAPTGTVMGCVDDDPACVACHGVVTFTAVAGTTYTIRVASWNTSAGNPGNLVITDP